METFPILVIHPNPATRDLLTTLLKDNGFSVRAEPGVPAVPGKATLAVVEAGPEAGLLFIKTLRERAAAMPIIALVGAVDERLQEGLARYDVCATVSRPVSPRQFLDIIKVATEELAALARGTIHPFGTSGPKQTAGDLRDWLAYLVLRPAMVRRLEPIRTFLRPVGLVGPAGAPLEEVGRELARMASGRGPKVLETTALGDPCFAAAPASDVVFLVRGSGALPPEQRAALHRAVKLGHRFILILGPEFPEWADEEGVYEFNVPAPQGTAVAAKPAPTPPPDPKLPHPSPLPAR